MSVIQSSSWSQPPAASATLTRIDDRDKWQRLVSAFHDYNYRQGWDYGLESAARNGARIERVALRVGTELVGAAMVRLKKVPLLNAGMAYIGGGPLVRRGGGDDLMSLRVCLEALCREYIGVRGYLLRVLPPLQPAGGHDGVIHCFESSQFERSPWPPPYRTIVVNLDRPLAEVRRTLAQKWRNGLNNAEKRGLVIQSGTEPELFRTFERIFESFMDRKQISVAMGAEFYRDVRARGADEGYRVCLALADGQPVAGQLISLAGDTGVTLLAAVNDAGMKCKASNLVQWQAIAEAHGLGMRWFDLGGIEPQQQPGVYHFKQGLGGVELAMPGPFQAVPPGVLGPVVPAVEKLYRWTRRRLRA